LALPYKKARTALRPDIAAEIMRTGMVEGWFTGVKLSDFFNDKRNDAVNARRIINGLDHAADIDGFYAHFCAALKAGGY
jgi:putative chitinase